MPDNNSEFSETPPEVTADADGTEFKVEPPVDHMTAFKALYDGLSASRF